MELITPTMINGAGQSSLSSGEALAQPCPYCGKLLKRESFTLLRKVFYGPLEICDCPEGRAAAKRAEEKRAEKIAEEKNRALESRQRYSGLSVNQLNQFFYTFEVNDGNRDAYDAAFHFAMMFKPRRPDDRFIEGAPQSLMFLGKAGVGKTHLAAAIANYLIDAGSYVTFRTVPELLAELKRTYGHGDGDEYAMMRSLKRTVLLILDDLGKEQQTEWSLSRLYELINSRYENRMPMIVTSNYTPKELFERLNAGGDKNTAMAILSRLAGMCKTVGIFGNDRRVNVS